MYRPRVLSEFIGQPQLSELLAVTLHAATRKKAPLPHMLLSGPGGTGKTTLARILARERGYELVVAASSDLTSDEAVLDFFDERCSSEAPSLVFLDEAHQLSRKGSEALLVPLEQGRFADSDRHMYHMKQPWSIIMATTNPGKLIEPLRSRMGLQLVMKPYTEQDILTIIKHACEEQYASSEPEALRMIAARSRSNPRLANHLLDRCEDYVLALGKRKLTAELAGEAFDMMGIDALGLTWEDRDYLKALGAAGRPIGLASLVPVLHLDRETIEAHIEPYLVESGLVELTGQGRALSSVGSGYAANSTMLRVGESNA